MLSRTIGWFIFAMKEADSIGILTNIKRTTLMKIQNWDKFCKKNMKNFRMCNKLRIGEELTVRG